MLGEWDNSSQEHMLSNSRVAVNRKRRYQRLLPWQRQLLGKHFASGDFWPNREAREALAAQLGIDQRKVQIWFQNERAKASISSVRPESQGGFIGSERTPSPESSSQYSGDEVDADRLEEVKHAEILHSLAFGSSQHNNSYNGENIIAPLATPFHSTGDLSSAFRCESAPSGFSGFYSSATSFENTGPHSFSKFSLSENSAFSVFTKTSSDDTAKIHHNFLVASSQEDMDLDQDAWHVQSQAHNNNDFVGSYEPSLASQYVSHHEDSSAEYVHQSDESQSGTSNLQVWS